MKIFTTEKQNTGRGLAPGPAAKIFAAAGLLLAAGFTSCVTDPISNTPNPNQGGITLTTDWTDTGISSAPPSGYTVVVGDYVGEVTANPAMLDEFFDPGDYKIYVYTAATASGKIEVSGTGSNLVAKVETVTAPEGAAGTFVAADPSLFYSGTLDASIEKDKQHSLTVPMKQQVREVTLVMTPSGGLADKVEAIQANLSGVAGGWNIDTDRADGDAVNVALNFVKQTEGINAGKWAATARLMGTVGQAQRLTGKIKFTGGSPADQEIDDDLSQIFAGFNSAKHTALTAQIGEFETPYVVTIVPDWSQIGSGLTPPADYTVRNGEFSESATGASHQMGRFFSPGNYDFDVFNTARNVTIEGDIARVAYDGALYSAPGWLYTSRITGAQVAPDQANSFTALMRQQVGELTLAVEVTGSGAANVTAITGELSGVALEWNFVTDTPQGNPKNIKLNLTKQATGDYAGIWTSTTRLLGVTGDQQVLSVKVYDTYYNLVSSGDEDVTTKLSGFNDHKNTPTAVRAESVEVGEPLDDPIEMTGIYYAYYYEKEGNGRKFAIDMDDSGSSVLLGLTVNGYTDDAPFASFRLAEGNYNVGTGTEPMTLVTGSLDEGTGRLFGTYGYEMTMNGIEVVYLMTGGTLNVQITGDTYTLTTAFSGTKASIVSGQFVYEDFTGKVYSYTGTIDWEDKTVVRDVGNFEDIPENTYNAAGAPAYRTTPGPGTWTGSLSRTTLEGKPYYMLAGWGGVSVPILVVYRDGLLFMDQMTPVVQDAGNSQVYGFAGALYVNGDDQLGMHPDSEDYRVKYDAGSKTFDFSNTYNGYDCMVGILAFDFGDGGLFTETYTDLYKGAMVTLTDTPSRAGRKGVAPAAQFSGTKVDVSGYELSPDLKARVKRMYDAQKSRQAKRTKRMVLR